MHPSDAPTQCLQYTTIAGVFLQDEPTTDPSKFDHTAVNFGLIARTYDTDVEYDPSQQKSQWQRFSHFVFSLNEQCRKNTTYKILYMGRHGQGVHNVAESLYGTPAWNDHWSKLEGNGSVTWVDAHLTEKGEQQALSANKFWAQMIATQNIPLPERYYTSPLDRCLATATLTFTNLPLLSTHPFIPQVKELLRETNGVHTCDRRSSKSYIRTNYPTFIIEPGFSEEDELWDPDVRETDEAQDVRMRKLLDDMFIHDDSTYISLTSHSGSIGSLLRVLGHRDFRLQTGGVIPVLVKAETVDANT